MKHGFGEKSLFALLALLGAWWLWHRFGADVAFDLIGTTGGLVQKLVIINAIGVVLLFSFAGVRYDLVAELKRRDMLYGLVAIFCTWLLANATVMVFG